MKGNVSGKIVWANDPSAHLLPHLAQAQNALDNAVLQSTNPFVPLRTGNLIASGQAGNGKVTWGASYAAFQYYSTALSRPYSAQRGGEWFARSKAQNLSSWIATVQAAWKGA